MQCGRCGRTLKNPKYQKLGFGRVCYSKHLQEASKDKEKGAETDAKETQCKDRA